MGLPPAALRLLLATCRNEPFTGSVLTLGKQDTWITAPPLRKAAASFGVELADVPLTVSPKPIFARHHYLTDESILRALGFADYHSMDLSAYESADIIHDLNSPDVPAALVDRFDTIIDGGTLEHVFHLPNALAGIGEMLKVGGRVIHHSPASNWVDHGFYMFSPTLFWDYYNANKFEIGEVRLIGMTQRHRSE